MKLLILFTLFFCQLTYGQNVGQEHEIMPITKEMQQKMLSCISVECTINSSSKSFQFEGKNASFFGRLTALQVPIKLDGHLDG